VWRLYFSSLLWSFWQRYILQPFNFSNSIPTIYKKNKRILRQYSWHSRPDRFYNEACKTHPSWSHDRKIRNRREPSTYDEKYYFCHLKITPEFNNLIHILVQYKNKKGTKSMHNLGVHSFAPSNGGSRKKEKKRWTKLWEDWYYAYCHNWPIRYYL
jgi:hypothetical protein